MTKAIILFRYHKAYDVCAQRLKLLRRLNPDVPIHGLYGADDPIENLPKALTSLFESNWQMPLDDWKYKWMNGDLCARAWFRDHGQQLDFDHVYFLEWDQLFLKPLAKVYGPLRKNSNYATIHANFKAAKKMDLYWLREQYGYETSLLLKHLEEIGRPVDLKKLSFSIMGGAVFCRKFLELYCAEPIPSYSNDEVRFSIYSKAFGIPLINNGIMAKAKAGQNFYNADNLEAKAKDVDHVIKSNGDVIHPVRKKIKNLEKRLGLIP